MTTCIPPSKWWIWCMKSRPRHGRRYQALRTLQCRDGSPMAVPRYVDESMAFVICLPLARKKPYLKCNTVCVTRVEDRAEASFLAALDTLTDHTRWGVAHMLSAASGIALGWLITLPGALNICISDIDSVHAPSKPQCGQNNCHTTLSTWIHRR